jgi:hypothetical protein
MRSIASTVVFAAAFAGILSMGAPAQAQPNGSYLQTCRNVRVLGEGGVAPLLTAQCQTSRGTWTQSNLFYRRCRGDIFNENGNLRCEGGGSGDIGGMPSGTWRQSCRDGYVDGRRLYAECRRNNGRWQDASLNLQSCPRGPVGNNNGTLYCEGGSGGGLGLPGGSWRQSCRDGHVDGRTLYAECRRNNGRWQGASLNLQTCPRGPVGNRNGNLFCEGIPGSDRVRLTLYQNFNFSGRTLQLTGPAPDLRDYNFDDRASSLRVEGPWYVCSNINYSGDCTKVSGTFNLSSKWNKRISSARPGP